MILRTLTISGFKSFRRPVPLHLSNRTTVLIGPNDHGKTNVLLAVGRLDAKNEFVATDVNDRAAVDAAQITYQFILSEAEIQALEVGIKPMLEKERQSATERLSANQQAGSGSEPGTGMTTLSEMDALLRGPLEDWWKHVVASRQIELSRQPGKPLEPKTRELADDVRVSLMELVLPLMPKVFLFTAEVLRQLPDTVNLATLETNEVMQGVFRLAGIWELRRELLAGNTRKNQDILRDASENLTAQIRKNWTQGKDLQFYLEYVGSDVRLTVKDTAKTVTAIVEHSDGFTAYFAMRMLLIARTDQASPNGYIFLFDEPGLNLHPKGQVDLQNVFEDISLTNQIIYSTHSVFLINKNYPERNHLIYKNEQGSTVDNKPFVGGWAKVKEHLGLYLSANFLFADKVLLVEGCTDEIYVPTLLQELVERKAFDGDLNGLAIRSSISSKEMLSLASVYIQEQRSVAVLVDGDDGGLQRKRKIEAWAQRARVECPVIILSRPDGRPCSIEDFLRPVAYLNALLAACKQAVDAGILQTQKQEWPAELKRLINTPDGKDGSEQRTLGKRVEAATSVVFSEPISDTSVAIKYGEMISPQLGDGSETTSGSEPDDVDVSFLEAADQIWQALKLATRGDLTKIPFAS